MVVIALHSDILESLRFDEALTAPSHWVSFDDENTKLLDHIP